MGSYGELARASDSALATLREPGWPVQRIKDNAESVSGLHVPGLYAVHGNATVWRQFGLGDLPNDRPLYVGKTETSLVSRDINTHFGRPKPGSKQSITGSSTLRRSLAALLPASHGYHGVPRNPDRPAHFASFGLSRDQDEKLTGWMQEHLTLAVGPKQGEVALHQVEASVLEELLPPLNLAKLPRDLDEATRDRRRRVKAARAALAQQARSGL